jgi:hypothetical protein
MRVSGSGNFDRVDTAMLEHLDQWKTYPPKSTFAGGDAVGYQGEKSFEQALIASVAGPQTLPPLRFSYFDPVARRYATLTSVPLRVTITPALGDISAPAPPKPGAVAGGDGTAQRAGGLRPDHALTETPVRTLRPLYLQAPFLALPALCVLGFAGAAWRQRRRVGTTHAGGRRQRAGLRAARHALAAGEAAASAGDSLAFCAAARELLAARGGHGDDVQELQNLLLLVDAQRYAEAPPAAVDWSRWLAALRLAARDLESV